MTNREKLFESALKIFGPNTPFSEVVQNPNCINSEEDLQKISEEAEKFIDDKLDQFRVLKIQVGVWLLQLRTDFRAGELKEW